MFLRTLYFLLLLFLITSCDKFVWTKNKGLQKLDTIIDFTAIDFYPSFGVCDSLIDKETEATCFRNTIHKKIGAELQKYALQSKDSLDETIYVDLIINLKREIILEKIISSDNLKQQLPQLDSLLKQSVHKLKVSYPAIKRGIPVTTKYRLPIRILFKE